LFVLVAKEETHW